MNIHVAFDLGSDTLKIAYAFEYEGKEYSGKIVPDETALMALPSVAYYHRDKNAWYYADEVAMQQADSYLTVVKIKDLLTLLQKKSGKSDPASDSVVRSNADYYANKSLFPKFVFPIESEKETDFSKLNEKNKTFTAEGATPRSVCENYFRHVAALVEARLKVLLSDFPSDRSLVLSIVYPPNIGDRCIAELKRLVYQAFGGRCRLGKVLSLTKCLSIYAKQKGFIGAGRSALVFNVGEDKTFVAKTNIERQGVSIDGVEGHNSPITLGGNDIDNAVADFLEGKMEDRETMGSPSAGKSGHVYERGLLTKQYLFLKEIKTAKIFFGMCEKGEAPFSDGVPINVVRDLNIRLKLTHAEFARCVGLEGGEIAAGSFAARLRDYIETEYVKNLNRNVKHIFITGGVVETYGLIPALEKYFARKYEGLSLRTFENTKAEQYDGKDGFRIYAHEDSVYAPAVGCALASMKDLNVDTLTSLTYGTDVYRNNETGGRSCFFAPLVGKGTKIGENGARAAEPFPLNCTDEGSLLIFSMSLTKEEVESKKLADELGLCYDGGRLFLYNTDGRKDPYETMLERKIDFRRRNSKEEAAVHFFYRGRRVRFDYICDRTTRKEARVFFDAGIEFDANGIAKPYVGNSAAKNANTVVRIRFYPFTSSATMEVNATDIEFRAHDFTVKIDGAD